MTPLATKQDTRRMPLDIIRERSSFLWSREKQRLRYDWVELAGPQAPTLQIHLDENTLGPGASFIGVDTDQKTLRGCLGHYGPDVPARWHLGNLITELRSPARWDNVGVVVFDSWRAVRGNRTITPELVVLTEFAHRQQKRLGEFLLVLNVTIPPRRFSERDIQAYQRLVAGHFPDLRMHDGSFIRYTSQRDPMLWTAICLGF